jgi:hypothetical protein
MIIRERRSGIDTRSEAEKLLVGERRSGVDRRTGETAPTAPSKEQLGLFARRLRRAMRDQSGRGYFGIANGENEFSFYPDVVRVVEWIERLSIVEPEQQARPTLRKTAAGTTDPSPDQTSELQTASARPDAP